MKKSSYKIFYASLFCIGLVGVINFVLQMLWNNGLNFGVFFPLVVGAILMVLSYLKLKKNIVVFRNKLIRKIAMALIALFLISFVAVEALIFTSAKSQVEEKTEYAIILGAGLKGERITLTFQYRIDNCIEYMKKNPEVKVVVSGGQGYGETITEAEAMKRYLIKNGIKEDRIIKEDKSTSTLENFKNSKAILDSKFGEKQYSLMIFTNDFHMYRSKLIAERVGFKPYGITAKTDYRVFANSCIREYFAVIKSMLFDR